ncbi:MAG TPA: DUF3892 domain-containing protein [Ignavibacteria bacterium]|nr:DUF3892 domain-containing protein [Ignavibacteria bacterium]
MAVKITCISKDSGNHENPYTAISNLGWVNESTGKKGNSTRLEMYDFVENKGGDAYVKDPYDGSKVYLVGAVSSKGTKYVKTVPNDTEADNLLKLPEC